MCDPYKYPWAYIREDDGSFWIKWSEEEEWKEADINHNCGNLACDYPFADKYCLEEL
jgi:hypothetical protein